MPFSYATKTENVAQRREVERKFRQEEDRVVDLKQRANDLQKEMLTAERNLNALRAIIQKYETLVKDSIEHQRQLIRYINPNLFGMNGDHKRD